MPANDRRDLIRRLKVKHQISDTGVPVAASSDDNFCCSQFLIVSYVF